MYIIAVTPERTGPRIVPEPDLERPADTGSTRLADRFPALLGLVDNQWLLFGSESERPPDASTPSLVEIDAPPSDQR